MKTKLEKQLNVIVMFQMIAQVRQVNASKRWIAFMHDIGHILEGNEANESKELI
jgi:predicted HD phosphohydrolase